MRNSAIRSLIGPAATVILDVLSRGGDLPREPIMPLRTRRRQASSHMKQSVATMHNQIKLKPCPAWMNPKTFQPHTHEQEIARRLRQKAKIEARKAQQS